LQWLLPVQFLLEPELVQVPVLLFRFLNQEPGQVPEFAESGL
jgi:hypothetical protein